VSCLVLTRRLSSVRSTATPASTLPTVNDTSIVAVVSVSVLVVDRVKTQECLLIGLMHQLSRSCHL
jgi:hypothetical protein